MDLLLAARWGDTQAIPTHAKKQDKGVSARRTFRGMADFSNLALVACRVWVAKVSRVSGIAISQSDKVRLFRNRQNEETVT